MILDQEALQTRCRRQLQQRFQRFRQRLQAHQNARRPANQPMRTFGELLRQSNGTDARAADAARLMQEALEQVDGLIAQLALASAELTGMETDLAAQLEHYASAREHRNRRAAELLALLPPVPADDGTVNSRYIQALTDVRQILSGQPYRLDAAGPDCDQQFEFSAQRPDSSRTATFDQVSDPADFDTCRALLIALLVDFEILDELATYGQAPPLPAVGRNLLFDNCFDRYCQQDVARTIRYIHELRTLQEDVATRRRALSPQESLLQELYQQLDRLIGSL